MWRDVRNSPKCDYHGRIRPEIAFMLTAEQARELLSYDPETGELSWVPGAAGSLNRRGIAGGPHPGGYWMVKVGGRNYSAHRLAWLIQTGEWPLHQVDHINRSRADNRWCNLRAASRNENCRNSSISANNTSGAQNVNWHKTMRKWAVSLCINSKKKWIGAFDDFEFAELVAHEARRRYFGEFAPGVEHVIA